MKQQEDELLGRENFASIDRKMLHRLIEKYAGSTPRYTSYPTAVEFHNGIDPRIWRDILIQETNNPLKAFRPALYIHVPFCHSLCYFCACNKTIAKDDSQVEPYIRAVANELNAYGEISGSKPLEQLHWGGGTPNFLSPSASEQLFEKCCDAFPRFTKNADISVEIDPRTSTFEHLNTYRQLGFNRVSLGVQDFNSNVQNAINRVQPFEQTKEVIEAAQALGFSGINLDLIYGLPEQTLETFKDTIRRVISLQPERIALYGYAHVTWKVKVQKSLHRYHLPSPAERIALFLFALEALTDAGYDYIGLDHFALPRDSLSRARRDGKLNRNFMGYSTHKGTSVLGVGVSAISSCDSMLAQNTCNLKEYLNNTPAQVFMTERGLVRTTEDQLRAELIEKILCLGVIDISNTENKWQINFRETFYLAMQMLEGLEQDGLVRVTDTHIRSTMLGRLFMRTIASVFDAYLAKHTTATKFSQGV